MNLRKAQWLEEQINLQKEQGIGGRAQESMGERHPAWRPMWLLLLGGELVEEPETREDIDVEEDKEEEETGDGRGGGRTRRRREILVLERCWM